MNMFAYCLNNPTSYLDSEGTFALLATVVTLVVLIKTCDDMIALTRNDKQVKAVELDGGPIRIQNSKDVETPWVQFGYSLYLNHFSEYKDHIKGSTVGVVFEWQIHNIAYDFATFGNAVGVDTADFAEKAEHVDLGTTIYDDSGHGGAGAAMMITYSVLFPSFAASDLVTQVLK